MNELEDDYPSSLTVFFTVVVNELEDDYPSSLTVFFTVVVTWLVVGAVLRAYVICQLWDWYVVPAFKLPEISLSTAFGLSLLVSLFVTAPTQEAKGKKWPELIGIMGGQLIGYAITLLIGWVVHVFT